MINMKIKTVLRINILLPVISFFLISIISIDSYRSLTSITLKRDTIREFSFAVFDLNLLTMSLIHDAHERPRIQWKSKYQALVDKIRNLSFDEPDRNDKFLNVKRNLEIMGLLYSQLKASYDDKEKLDPGLAHEARERLESQLLERAQSVSTDCSALLFSMNKTLNKMNINALLLVLSATAFLMLLTAGTLNIINRRIGSSLDKLKKGTEIIGSGVLDYKIDMQTRDEVGEFSRAFDEMTAKLKNTTVSRDDLIAEMAVRKRAEEELGRYRNRLEELVRERTAELESEIAIRMQAETALAVEKEMLAVTLRSIGDGVITTDLEGNIVLMNKVAERLTGWSLEASSGKRLDEIFRIIDAETREDRESPVRKVLKHSAIMELPDNTILIEKDGKERLINDSVAPIRNRESKDIGVVLVFRDITEKQKMEEELVKIQKLESVGVLAGGIAHDFNNALSAILTNISVAKILQEPGSKSHERLTAAENASKMARNLTRQLLTFSKGGAPIKKTESLERLITESADFALTGTGVKCDYSFAKDLWLADVDEGQINQAVSNLVINACQAMPGGGIISITVDNVVLSDSDATHLKEGKYLRISVKDNGAGIAEKDLPMIFDPYFTTKQEGIGLGLATTYSIIKKHHGHISAESKIGEGTTFIIYLPASEAGKDEAQADSGVVNGTKTGMKLLVMDDDIYIRESLGAALAIFGYKVSFSSDGTSALELYKKEMSKGSSFDAVILDLTIPGGMGGKETIEELLRIDPKAKAVASSGYTTGPIMAEYRKYGFQGVIAKPYEIDELNMLLNRVISGKGV